MNLIKRTIDGLILLKPTVFKDERGGIRNIPCRNIFSVPDLAFNQNKSRRESDLSVAETSPHKVSGFA